MKKKLGLIQTGGLGDIHIALPIAFYYHHLVVVVVLLVVKITIDYNLCIKVVEGTSVVVKRSIIKIMVVVVAVVVVVGVDLVGGEEISMEFGFNPPLEYLKHYHVSSNSNFG